MKKKYDKPVVNVIHANCGGFMAETISTVTSSDTSGNDVGTDIGGSTQTSDGTENTSKGHTILWDEDEE